MKEYIIHLIVMALLYSLLSGGFSLAYNFTGLINLSYVGFFAIGAYSYALFTMILFDDFISAMILTILISGFLSYIVSLSTHRFKSDSLALVTLGFAVILDVLLKNMTWLTNGPMGISAIEPPKILGLHLSNTPFTFFIILLIASFFIFTFLKLLEIKKGTILLAAIYEDEVLLNSLGKNTFKIKTTVIVISSVIASICGVIYASYISFIDPYAFSLNILMLIILIATMIKKSTSIAKIIGASAIIVIIPEVIKLLQFPSRYIAPLQQITFCIVLLVVMIRNLKSIKEKC